MCLTAENTSYGRNFGYGRILAFIKAFMELYLTVTVFRQKSSFGHALVSLYLLLLAPVTINSWPTVHHMDFPISSSCLTETSTLLAVAVAAGNGTLRHLLHLPHAAPHRSQTPQSQNAPRAFLGGRQN